MIMKVELSHPDVFVTRERIVQATNELVGQLKEALKTSPRKRVRFCAHPDSQNRIHEMLIALDKSTYIRPHRHPGKSESFHVIEGQADIVVFDENGQVTDQIPLGDISSGRVFLYRISEPLFHTLIIHSDILIIHETTNGPFRPEECQFAPWAPEESDRERAAAYIKDLRKRIEDMGGHS
jgi:cupin fold WbuC family metalloprotein